MRHCAIALAALLFVSAAQAHPPGPDGEHEAHKPTIGDYEDALKHHTQWSENIANPNFYKELEFTMLKGEDEKKVKFVDLKEFEKNLFYLYQAENLSNTLARLEGMWNLELRGLPPVTKEIADDKKESLTEERLKQVADRKDVEGYITKLHDLRKGHAIRFEKLMTEVFTKFESEIPKADRENYTAKVKEWHDKQQLVERKKEAKSKEGTE